MIWRKPHPIVLVFLVGILVGSLYAALGQEEAPWDVEVWNARMGTNSTAEQVTLTKGTYEVWCEETPEIEEFQMVRFVNGTGSVVFQAGPEDTKTSMTREGWKWSYLGDLEVGNRTSLRVTSFGPVRVHLTDETGSGGLTQRCLVGFAVGAVLGAALLLVQRKLGDSGGRVRLGA